MDARRRVLEESFQMASEGCRSVFLAEWFCGGLGYQNQNTAHFLKTRDFLAVPKSHVFLENLCFWGLGTPVLQKNTWLTNHFGIPLAERPSQHGSAARYTCVTCLPDPHPSPRHLNKSPWNVRPTLCYAIVLPGRKSAFRVGFWPDCCRESTESGPPVGLRPAGGPISVFCR